MKFRKQFNGEGAKHLQALWDYFHCQQNLQCVIDKYKLQESAPTTNYQTAFKWKNKFEWDRRCIEYQESLLAQDELTFENERQRWLMERLKLLEAHNTAINNAEIDLEGVSLAQYTNAMKTQMNMIHEIFNEMPVTKIAPTTPDGKEPYLQNDIAELLKLADAVKRRPE